MIDNDFRVRQIDRHHVGCVYPVRIIDEVSFSAGIGVFGGRFRRVLHHRPSIRLGEISAIFESWGVRRCDVLC